MSILDRSVKQRNGSMIWRTGPQITLMYPDEEWVYHAIRPDAAGQMFLEGQIYPILLEFDRSTENWDNLVEKVTKYKQYAERQLERRKYNPPHIPTRLLWITTNDDQMNRICTLLRWWCESLHGDDPIIIASYINTSDFWEALDILGDRWYREIPYQEPPVSFLDLDTAEEENGEEDNGDLDWPVVAN